MAEAPDLHIYVDADACPVKDEVYRVAARNRIPVTLVSNAPFTLPPHVEAERVVVGAGPDAADDWIAERANPRAIVITADVPLAHRCVKAGASVLAPNGRRFDENAIGMALAMRDLLTDLRSAGALTRGPPPFSPRDRSTFLQALEQTIRRARQGSTGSPRP